MIFITKNKFDCVFTQNVSLLFIFLPVAQRVDTSFSVLSVSEMLHQLKQQEDIEL